MFYNLFIKISLILVIIITFSICALKPEMHKSLLIYNSDYKIEETQNTVSKTKTTKKTEEQTYKMPTYTRSDNTKQNIETVANKQQQTFQQTNTTSKSETTKQEIQQKQPKSIEKQTKQTVTPKTKTLTIEEEEIQWNKWHSNIQNQIMKDVKLPILPQGTIFKFSFDVDKYGKISDIKTWSMTPSLTPYAIQYIAPVIRSYQGHSILNFPQGTKRYTTTFVGGWRIAENVQYSTPKDFNDKEIIQKKN